MDTFQKNLTFLLRMSQTQTAVAEAVGKHQSAVSKWSRGETKEPEFRSMAKLALALGVSLDELAWRDLEQDGPGRPSHPMGLDISKLADLLGTVEAAIEKARVKLPPKVKARWVASLYADKEASVAASEQSIRAALVGILATMETSDEPDAAR